MNVCVNTIDTVLADPLTLARKADFPLGYVGFDIPEDLLAADGVFAAHLPWQTGRKTPRADDWLEKSFPGWARSIVEDWVAGAFDFMPFVVFTRGDDVSQRLYYYICELQRRGLAQGPTALIFDIARVRKASSAAWTIAAVKHLAAELKLSESALQAGSELANQRREMMHALARDRQSPGHHYERIARASLFAPLESLQLDSPASLTPVLGRILLAGSSPPDDHLHRAVELAGWSVMDESYDRNLSRLGPVIETAGDDLFASIGRQAHASRVGPRAFCDRAAQLLKQAGDSRADAAIFWLIEEDEAIAWDLPASLRALQATGLPCLVMTRRAWDYSDRPENEIGQFLAGIAS